MVHKRRESSPRLGNLILRWLLCRGLVGGGSLWRWRLCGRPAASGYVSQWQKTSQTLHGTGWLRLGLRWWLDHRARPVLASVVSLEEFSCLLRTMCQQDPSVFHQVVVSLAKLVHGHPFMPGNIPLLDPNARYTPRPRRTSLSPRSGYRRPCHSPHVSWPGKPLARSILPGDT